MTLSELAIRLAELEQRALAAEISAASCDRHTRILAVHAADVAARTASVLTSIRKMQDAIRTDALDYPTEEVT